LDRSPQFGVTNVFELQDPPASSLPIRDAEAPLTEHHLPLRSPSFTRQGSRQRQHPIRSSHTTRLVGACASAKLPKTLRHVHATRPGGDVTIHSSAVSQLSMSTRVSADSHSSARRPFSVRSCLRKESDRPASELLPRFCSARSHLARGGSATSSGAAARFFGAHRLWVTTRLGRRRRL
jgi:hypothetical protein